MPKPIAESCLRNQAPIAEVLVPLLQGRHHVLEIASGTGQHAVYMANRLPDLIWQCSDLPECLSGINQWRKDAVYSNIPEPKILDVLQNKWPEPGLYDAVFTANSIHFVGMNKVIALIEGVGKLLPAGGLFCLYGPFNQQGLYTSEGNRNLDSWLKSRDVDSGIKDIEAVISLCADNKLNHQRSVSMPANNLILIFEKQHQTR